MQLIGPSTRDFDSGLELRICISSMPPGAATAADGGCYWPDCLSALRHRACQDCPEQHLSFLLCLAVGSLDITTFVFVRLFVGGW